MDGDGGKVTLVGLTLQDGLPGFVETVSETVPLNPFSAVIEIVEVFGVFTGVTIVVGFALIVKS